MISLRAKMEKQKSGWIYGLAAVSISFLILQTLFWYGFGADQGFFSYCAWVWRQFGQKPYIDIFDQAYPGIFFIHYLIQATLGESITAFRIFDLAWQTATATMIYLVVASVFRNRLAGFLGAIFYAIYYIGLGPWNTGQRDGFFLLLYLLSFRLFIPRKEGRDIPHSALAGILIGFAVLIKPVAALAALVFLLLSIKTTKSKFLSALAFAGGCCTPLIAVIFYYWRLGGLRDLYLSLFYFTSKVYVDYELIDRPTLLAGVFMIPSVRFHIIILLGAALLIPLRKRIAREKESRLSWLLLILLAAYAGYFSQAKYFYYHQAPVWGTLCLMAGAGWALLIDFLNMRLAAFGKAKTAVFSAMLILLSILTMDESNTIRLRKAFLLGPNKGRYIYPYHSACRHAAKYIELHSGPQDKVQVWGGEAAVNFYARRKCPSRFPTTLNLIPFRPGPQYLAAIQRELGQELLNSIRKDPPLYFIVSRNPYFYNEEVATALIQDYPELWQLLETNYRHEKTIEVLEIYRLKK